MAHLVLYRNFRPKTFDEVVEQEHIVTTLRNQIINNSFGHAYLFCGTRGTGKTSIAKIFARAVNCQNPQNGDACGKCPACLSNQNGDNLDIVEIDAASNNRVDEIRDLREKIGYLPSVNKYKVYIVDEVHMLTDSAFNALLKTLEEPPQHAIFILATTEPHKLPATILSRCMRFDFKLVSEKGLANHLKNVFSKSGIKSDDESLKLIASAGQGSVRDTLSVAEMVSAYSNNNITYEKTLECLGKTDSKTVLSILNAISTKNAKELLTIMETIKADGKNFSVLVNDIIKAFTDLITIKLSPDSQQILSLPTDLFNSYKLVAQNISEAELLFNLKTLTELDSKLKLASSVDLLVETTLLSMIITNNDIIDLKQRVDELEKKTLNENVPVSNQLNQEIEKKSELNVKSFSSVENGLVNDKNQVATNNQEDLSSKKNNSLQEVKIDSQKFENDNVDIQNLNAKKLFGEILLALRKSKNLMLYSVLGDVSDVKIDKNDFVITASKLTFDALISNKTLIENMLSSIEQNLNLVIQKTDETQKIDIKEFLMSKFETISFS